MRGLALAGGFTNAGSTVSRRVGNVFGATVMTYVASIGPAADVAVTSTGWRPTVASRSMPTSRRQ